MFAAYEAKEKSKCPLYERLIACCNWCDVGMLRRIDDHLAGNRCSLNHQPLNELTVQRFPCTTPLLVACYLGRLDVVQHIVEKWDVDVNEPGMACLMEGVSQHVTPLFMAVAIGNERIISYLIGKGADVSSCKSSIGNSVVTPLHAAIHYLEENEHKKDIIRLLIQSGADPSAFTPDGKPMWMFFDDISLSGIPIQHSSFALMVDMGMKLDQCFPHSGLSVLHHWAGRPELRNSLDMVKYLHAQGVSIFQTDKNGRCPLITAALGWYRTWEGLVEVGIPNCDVVEYLLEQPGISRQDKIDALEIAGAMIFIRLFNDTVAQCLRGPTGYVIQGNKLYDMFENDEHTDLPGFCHAKVELYDWFRSHYELPDPSQSQKNDARCDVRQSGYWLKKRKLDIINRFTVKFLNTISYGDGNPFIAKAFDYWERAIQHRLDGGEAFRKTTLSPVDFVEWTTMSELKHNQKGPIDCTMQACFVLLRIFKSRRFSFLSCCHDSITTFMDWLKECKDSRLLDVSWAVLEAIRHNDSSEWEFSDLKKEAFTGIVRTLSLLEEIGCDRLNTKTLSRMLQLIDCPGAKQSAMETRWEKKRSCSTDYECTYFHVAIKLLEIIARRPEVINDEIKQQVKRLIDGNLTSSEGLIIMNKYEGAS